MVVQQVAPRIELRLHRERDPNVGAHTSLAPLKGRRRHSHDGIGLLIEFNGLADDLRVGREMGLPQAITDHCHGRTAWLLVFLRKKTTPKKWTHAKYIKIVRRCHH